MRLFIGIKPDRKSIDMIMKIVADLKEMYLPVKWVQRDNLHITLRFLGDRNCEETDKIISVLDEEFTVNDFDVSLRGVGFFGKNGSIRTIWIGIDVSKDLYELTSQLNIRLNSIDIPIDGRKFSPHITIGRVKKNFRSGKFEKYILKNSESYVSKFNVNSFSLIKSELFPRGPVYSDLKTVKI